MQPLRVGAVIFLAAFWSWYLLRQVPKKKLDACIPKTWWKLDFFLFVNASVKAFLPAATENDDVRPRTNYKQTNHSLPSQPTFTNDGRRRTTGGRTTTTEDDDG